MKYIIFENEDFIIFPDTMNHKDVCINSKPIAAGFCQIRHYLNQWDDLRYEVSCWGESTTLGLKSRTEDEIIMSNTLK